MQIAQRGMTQPQGVDREPPARFGREKRRDGLGRGRQGGLAMFVAPVGKAGDGGAISPPGIFGAGGAPVIGGGGFGLGKIEFRRGNSTMVSNANQSRTSSGSAPLSRRAARAAPAVAAKGTIAVSRPIRHPGSSDSAFNRTRGIVILDSASLGTNIAIAAPGERGASCRSPGAANRDAGPAEAMRLPDPRFPWPWHIPCPRPLSCGPDRILF